jgi:hypothetical protein
MRRWLQYGPLRPLTGTLSNLVVSGQLTGARLRDGLGPGRNTAAGSGDITALVKTFERPDSVRRLLESLRRHYPKLAVVVVDDSREPVPLPGTTFVSLPFDSGVSAGRQAGLDIITTPYTLLLDDDFVVHGGTRLARPLEALRREPPIDLVAGKVIDLPFPGSPRRGGLWPNTAQPAYAEGESIGGLPVTHKPPNFYLARTERLRKVGWDPMVKRLDHADFFTRALGELVCVQDDRWSILHAKNPFDEHYQAFRQDVAGDRLYLTAKYGAGR